MEEIWSDLSSAKGLYTPPDWHESILRERVRQADAGELGYTDWETAKLPKTIWLTVDASQDLLRLFAGVRAVS